MKVVLQSSNQDCLLACYSMILSHFGSKIPIYKLYDEELIPPDGLSLRYLKQLNHKFELDMHAYKGEFEEVLSAIEDIKQPLIAQWSNDHFIIIKKVGKKNIDIIDPAFGERKITLVEFSEKFSNYIIILSPKTSFKKRIERIEIFSILKEVFLNKTSFLYVFSLLIGQLVTVIFSIILRNILSEEIGNLISFCLLIAICTSLIISFVFKLKAQVKSNYLYEKKISRQIFSGIFSRPLLYFRNNSTGAIMEKLNLKSSVRDSILFQIIPATINFLSVFLLIFYLGTVSVKLVALLVGLSLLFSLVNLFLYKIKNNYNMNYVQKTIETTTIMQEDLEQIDQIKAQNLESIAKEKWNEISWSVQSAYNDLLKIDGLSTQFNQIFNYTSLIIIITLGMNLVVREQLSVADLLLFQTGVSLFNTAFSQLQTAFFEFSKVRVYGDRVNDLLVKLPKTNDIIDSNSAYIIQAKNLSYCYSQDTTLFENINISIKRGEKIAIVGASGAGKSTLINVMLGLYRFSGNLIYGEENIREKIGVVLQNMTLKKGTILDNLVNNIEEYNDIGEIEGVLSDVNILDIVSRLPKKVYSNVFQKGKNLSGGQIQRILIAKSLLNDSKLVFWDEAFSSLDNKNRKHIYSNVLKNSKYNEKTIILVSHHLDVVDFVDKVLFIDEKEHTVHIGSHQELLTNKSYMEFVKKIENE